MFPQSLVTPIITLGSGCIIICISIFYYFRKDIDNHINEAMLKLFSKKETMDFINGLSDGKVSPMMLHDFYTQIIMIWKPKQLQRYLWYCFPISGSLYIIDGILATLLDSNILLYSYIIYSILILATVFFLICIMQLIRLGKYLM